MPTVHPMASVGTRGQHQTRTLQNVRSGMATIPGQEKLPGGSLETPPPMKSVGRPPIVTAAGSQRVRRYPRWGIAPEQGGTRTRNQASEAESPNLSRQIGLTRPIQANAPDEGRGGGFQAWLLPAGVFAVTSLPAAAATQSGQPRSLAGRLGCASRPDWARDAPSTYRRPTTGSSGPAIIAETAGGCRPSRDRRPGRGGRLDTGRRRPGGGGLGAGRGDQRGRGGRGRGRRGGGGRRGRGRRAGHRGLGAGGANGRERLGARRRPSRGRRLGADRS